MSEHHYVTLEKFTQWLADHQHVWDYTERPDISGALFSTEARLLRYIVPNVPRCDYEVERFSEAVFHQCWFEASAGADAAGDTPANLKSFTVNGFSATIDTDKRNSILPFGICPDARAILALSGLTYKGVVVC